MTIIPHPPPPAQPKMVSCEFQVYLTIYVNNEKFPLLFPSSHFKNIQEGPERVNWELGFARFRTGKIGFRSLVLGFESEKKAKMGMGLVFC